MAIHSPLATGFPSASGSDAGRGDEWDPGEDWWRRAVIYQVYLRSFQDSTGNGVGDLEGLRSRLGYLSDTLGVDAVWVSPFYPSPMEDFGYDVADYTEVDRLFGTLTDFDAVVAEAHGRSMAVIVDWVPNHTSSRHPWFEVSRSSRSSPKRDWYVWADATPDGGPPNNWLSVFGGTAWEWDVVTSQYYLHSFLPSQPDLNWRNPEVRTAMFDTVRFWLDRGVDGIRIDVADFLMKDPVWRDNPTAAVAPNMFKARGAYDHFDHIHDKAHPDVHGVFREFRQILESYDGNRVCIGEIHEWDPERWASYYGTNNDELHMPFNFSMLYTPWAADEVRRRVESFAAHLPDEAWPNHVLGNHDEPRLASRFGTERARAAALLLLTLRGTPTLYYGDELGMTDVPIPPGEEQDPWGQRVPGLGRDGARTPMPWTSSNGEGFTSHGVTPWLPIGDGVASVDEQLADSRSILAWYRSLLALRRARPALHSGDMRFVDVEQRSLLAYERTAGLDRILIALNFSGEPATFRAADGAEALLSSHGRTGVRPGPDGSFELAGDEGLVIDVSR